VARTVTGIARRHASGKAVVPWNAEEEPTRQEDAPPMPALDEKLHDLYTEVLHRNPGDVEFHQAVHEVLDSLGPVVAKHPEHTDGAVIRRLCEPERQIIFRVP
jgi:hypothetical protein